MPLSSLSTSLQSSRPPKRRDPSTPPPDCVRYGLRHLLSAEPRDALTTADHPPSYTVWYIWGLNDNDCERSPGFVKERSARALADSARHDLADANSMRAAARRVLSFLSDVDCFPRSEMDPSLSSLVRCFQAPHRLRAAQQSCQDMTCHLLTTLQLQSSSHASSRHDPSWHDPRRRHLARQGPDCKVTITMSASSIAQRQTCCQATAS